jgi:hypothetical protein
MKMMVRIKKCLFLLVIFTPSIGFLSNCTQVKTPKDNINALITKDSLKNIEIGLELYRREFGEYPETLDEWLIKKGITRKNIIEDAWGRKYYYLKVNDSYTLFSVGRDKKAHTEDDVHPPEKPNDI